MLRSIAEQPLLGIAKRCDLLQLSRRKGMACRDRLIDLGYAQAEHITIPEGKTVLLALAEPARRWLKRHHITPAPLNGSLPHAYWQHRLAEQLRSTGWQVQTEHTIGSTRLDVRGEKDGRVILIECETGRSAWRKNLEALTKVPADHRAVLWLDRASQLQAKQFVPTGVAFVTPQSVSKWLAQCDTVR